MRRLGDIRERRMEARSLPHMPRLVLAEGKMAAARDPVGHDNRYPVCNGAVVGRSGAPSVVRQWLRCASPFRAWVIVDSSLDKPSHAQTRQVEARPGFLVYQWTDRWPALSGASLFDGREGSGFVDGKRLGNRGGGTRSVEWRDTESE